MVIGLCYGGFGAMPSFTADYFGPRYMGGIYGWILLAWGAGAIPSPTLIAGLRQTTGRYDQAIYILAVVLLVAAVPPLLAALSRLHLAVEPRRLPSGPTACACFATPSRSLWA